MSHLDWPTAVAEWKSECQHDTQLLSTPIDAINGRTTMCAASVAMCSLKLLLLLLVIVVKRYPITLCSMFFQSMSLPMFVCLLLGLSD